MIVRFYAKGYLSMHFKESYYELKLKNDATIEDFYEVLNQMMGQDLPKAIWNQEKRRFRGPISIRIDGEKVVHESYRLRENQSIEFSRLLVGG